MNRNLTVIYLTDLHTETTHWITAWLWFPALIRKINRWTTCRVHGSAYFSREKKAFSLVKWQSGVIEKREENIKGEEKQMEVPHAGGEVPLINNAGFILAYELLF